MKLWNVSRMLMVLGVVLMLAAFSPPNWAQVLDLDVWNVPKYHAEIAACQVEAEEMEGDARALSHRIAVKDHLVKELIDGRTDLARVTDQFEALNRESPEVIDHLRDHYGVADARELSARNVIAFAETYLETEPLLERKSDIRHRLDVEFDTLFPDHRVD